MSLSSNAESEANPRIIDEKELFAELAKSVKRRSIATAYKSNMTKEEKKLRIESYISNLRKLKITEKKMWPQGWKADYGEEILESICKEWSLDPIKMLSEFRDYKMFDLAGEEFQKMLDISNTFFVSSADTEMEFSQMNSIITGLRNRLNIKTAANLMFIRAINMPVEKFDPTNCV